MKVIKDKSGNFVSVRHFKNSKKDKDTGLKFNTSKGEVYSVYETSNNRLYIIRKSPDGRKYKVYLEILK